MTEQLSPALMAMEANKWAVLIGVDYYISGDSRPGVRFHNLQGCVQDVRQVRDYLKQSFGVRAPNIYQLTAPALRDNIDGPAEDQIQPTYENIIDVLQKVCKKASPGDLVYIHYSGHGARVVTVFEDLKGDSRLDEALVPTDIHCGGRYIRDVEIAYLLQEMVKKQLLVTVVLDCCHSGGANRGTNHGVDSCRTRGVGAIDWNKLDSDISPFPHDELEIVAKRPAAMRKVKVVDHWLLESRGYTFLAACRAQESALEHEYDGKVQGVLTHSLLSTLKNNPKRLVCHTLWELVASKVREQSNQQHVVLGGEGDRLFYSQDRLALVYTPTIVKVDVVAGRNTAQLNVGTVHGISRGMEFDVWPSSCSDLSDSKPMGRLAVTVVQDVTAEALLIELLAPSQQLVPGCRAQLRNPLRLQRPVRLLYPDSLEEEDPRKKALDIAGEAWKTHGTFFAPLINEPTKEIFQVQVKNGTYNILDGNGQQLQNTIPHLSIHADHAAETLMRRLTHLAKYYNVLDLKNSESDPQISISLTKKPYSFPEQPRRSKEQPSVFPKEQVNSVIENEWLLLQVRNISGSALNITVLALDSLWAIEQIYPCGGAFETLDPGTAFYLPLKVTVPDGTVQSQVLDTIKVFATANATSFRWLGLAQLDQETLRCSFLPNRGNALELLQAAMMNEEHATRDGRICMPLGWDVQDAAIKIEHAN
ncbi:hypothetical protein NUW58_g357 [Xylaria curta]|uniref:Uncharacterized protein n=1 Tax=Xylaria curta TaxID=42375 RepID=A0ACC1PSB0_9PEZI|nr:hypothetical protein NUW58_g357 [Xylaria curta]